ncbi:hypothetical protein [Rahnella variigena]|uniref:hypothetical protein n=1 Tax=Rahnella variigena TaxID=574964 RepID=UPI00132FC99C|nr:hypothetical protein [Rahnella variigena]
MSDAYKEQVIEKTKAMLATAQAAADEIVKITKSHQGTDEELSSKILKVLGEYGQAHFKIASA